MFFSSSYKLLFSTAFSALSFAILAFCLAIIVLLFRSFIFSYFDFKFWYSDSRAPCPLEEERDVAGPADGATVEADVGVTETAG